MQITEVKIRKIFEGASQPLRAIASVTLDDELAVHDIKVIQSRERLFITMPGRKSPDGGIKDIIHPINSAFRQKLEGAVLGEYGRRLEEEPGERGALELSAPELS